MGPKHQPDIISLSPPSVMNLDDLTRRGLYLSDIPLHDATRDLVLLGEQFREEYKLTQELEILTDRLQHTLRALEDEKKKTDRSDAPERRTSHDGVSREPCITRLLPFGSSSCGGTSRRLIVSSLRYTSSLVSSPRNGFQKRKLYHPQYLFSSHICTN